MMKCASCFRKTLTISMPFMHKSIIVAQQNENNIYILTSPSCFSARFYNLRKHVSAWLPKHLILFYFTFKYSLLYKRIINCIVI